MTAVFPITRPAPMAAPSLLDHSVPRVRTTVLDSATLLARFGLAPHLVAHWVLDGDRRPVAIWREDIVPHRPSVARSASAQRPP